MTTLIKLGGSLITDKSRARAFRQVRTRQIVKQIQRIRTLQPDARLVIGHGSGSFGHFEASRHQTIKGVKSPEDLLGFAKVGEAAVALSQLVLNEFLACGLPVLRIQPSTLIVAQNGQIASMDVSLIERSLNVGLLPLLHGDVALDLRIGGTIISTETIFAHLAEMMPVSTIILLGEVDGVLDEDDKVVPEITPASFHRLRSALGESDGVDVTGGMLRKVEDMVNLVSNHPHLKVVIANGNLATVIEDLLLRDKPLGTLIQSG